MTRKRQSLGFQRKMIHSESILITREPDPDDDANKNHNRKQNQPRSPTSRNNHDQRAAKKKPYHNADRQSQAGDDRLVTARRRKKFSCF
jgi:hypothetical protein